MKISVKKTQLSQPQPLRHKKQKMSFYVTEQEAEQLRTICISRDISVSQLIREQVKRLLSTTH